jgi:tetratricopeptide (TPR) repeat protein
MALALALAWLATGCANPMNAIHYNDYLDRGNAALNAGDYPDAKIAFSRAVINARIGNLGPKDEARALYNYGLAVGMLCEYELSKQSFVDALRLEEQAEGPDGGMSVMRLFELARLEYDHGNYGDSARWYARALPLAQKVGADGSDPIAFANELDRYASALEKSGDPAGAAAARQQSALLREQHPGAEPHFVARTYPTKCASS